MQPIDWPQIIRGLVGSGMTQPKIAEHCRCGQSTVSDMLKGNTKDPRTTTGLLMLALARERGIPVPVCFAAPQKARDAASTQAAA